MEKQIIISISREYGSGGHVMAEMLAERFGLPFYDHNLLDEIAQKKNVSVENLSRYDEVPKIHGLSRRVRGHNNSPEEAIANMQFEFLKEKAASGESFVVVGRCSETVLKEYEGLVPIFVLSDSDAKVERIMQVREMNRKEAEAAIRRHDKRRKAYHNHYCYIKWGDSRNYDICINSSRLGLEKTTDYLESYIRERMK